MTNIATNPLLASFTTSHQTPPFDLIQTKDYKPAFEEAIKNAESEIINIAHNQEKPSFLNTISALANSGEKLDDISSIFFNLNSACTSDEMQKIAQEISPTLTEFSNNIYMNEKLFERIKMIYEQRETLNLSTEEKTLLDDTWQSFIAGGSNLKEDAKKRFKEISMELSKLTLQFEENVLAETNNFSLHITEENDMQGIPDGIKENMAHAAKAIGKEGWLITLHAPSFIPFMKYADNRSLREKLYRAYNSRGCRGNKYDNNQLIKRIALLRLEKANLLGFHSYAEYSLKKRMAESSSEVNGFLQKLLKASHPFALKDKEEVEEFAKKIGFKEILQRWDWAYFSNKLMQEKYKLDDELLRPYFKLENVQKGVFDLATSLYGITFKEVFDISKYQEDVRTFEVYDENYDFLSVLYLDFFPRDNKGGGAWMTEYRTQHYKNQEDIRPIVSLVMNFTKPTNERPSLLTFDEVTTFLHEFGHSLHGMLSRCKYSSMAGTNVKRDFVELPSQLMENWAYEKEWLDKWATHYQSGEKIPSEYIDRIRKAANFHSGYACDRQLSFGIVDMAWHSITKPVEESVAEFEQKAMAETEIFPSIDGCCFCTAFGHIFSGGYAAGYYSYKWAEVLDADAFALFKENGIFDKATAASFRKNILERGGSEHPMNLYIQFRGRKPDINALLKRSGLA